MADRVRGTFRAGLLAATDVRHHALVMPWSRIVEPELMDGHAQAEAYARADFAEPNAQFCRELGDRMHVAAAARVVDLGCGPADIPVRLAREHARWHIDAVDGSNVMLAHARRAIEVAGVGDRVRACHALLPGVALPAGSYDVVISNSLLHHLHAPEVLWAEVARLGREDAAVMVMDLMRPEGPDEARAIVERYAANEAEVLREDFYRSLCAAFTLEEVRDQLDAAGLHQLALEAVSDRHMLVWGTVASRE